MCAFGGRMVKEEGCLWTIPSIGFIVFIKFDFQVDLHENNNNSIIQLIPIQFNPTKGYHYSQQTSNGSYISRGNPRSVNCLFYCQMVMYTVVILLVLILEEYPKSNIMTNLINLQQTPLSLSLIKTVTQVLAYRHNLIIILGHCPESLKRLQAIYQIYDSKQCKSIKNGKISKFGVIFLTPYVLYDLGGYLTLVNSSGSKKIIRQGFGMSESKTVVGEIRFQKFEQKAKTQSYVLYHSPIYKKIYLLQHLKFSEEEHQIFLRAYEDDKQVIAYRIIALQQQIPQIVCSPKKIIFICGSEVTVYKQRFEPQYFAISNMQQFDILAFYNDFILQFKQDSSIFTMSLNGVIRPLLEQPVASHWFAHDRLYFLIHNQPQRKSTIRIFKVKDSCLVEQSQMESEYGSSLLFINSEQIIVGRK